jgi:hypothetical protein
VSHIAWTSDTSTESRSRHHPLAGGVSVAGKEKIMDSNERPSWWLCYLIGALMIGLLVLDYSASLSDGWHTIFACCIVLGCYGLIAWWLRADHAALLKQDWEEQIERLPSQRRDVPLSPVQVKYLRVMKQHNGK